MSSEIRRSTLQYSRFHSLVPVTAEDPEVRVRGRVMTYHKGVLRCAVYVLYCSTTTV
jgi:hypothetical protein